MKTRIPTHTHSITLNIAILVAVAILLMSSIVLVRDKLLQNAQELGNALARSYAVEEETTIQTLVREVDLVSQYVAEFSVNSGDLEPIQAWLSSHFSRLMQVMADDGTTGTMLDFYAVVGGQIVAVNPWVGDQSYPYQNTDWYRQAIEAGGEVVCGEIYTDAVTGELVFTISKALNDRGDVFALDVYVQRGVFHHNSSTLPADCSYYLCDSTGKLIYSITKWDVSQEDLQRYADYMLGGIADGSLLSYDSSFDDLDGIPRGVYYQTMSNGWIVMLTIPINSILMGDQNAIVNIFAGLAIMMFLILGMATITDIFRSRQIKRADDTAHMLGDSFYAIYHVNFVDGYYERFKSSDDLEADLPPKGPYSQLLLAISSVVHPDTFHMFEEGFSLDSIRQRVDQNIPDYGGDYLRRFGEDYRWVNVRTLYDPALIPNEVILCFRDVDAEKRRDVQHTIILQEALDAAQKSTKSKTEFFSRMSHDMRTPLNAIIGCCSLAEKSCSADDREKVRDYLKKIEFAGNQLLSLINDILELSRMEAGKNNLDVWELDLKQLLCDTADIFQIRAQSEGKELSASIAFQDCIVSGDEKKISQIINNLLSNAIKYTDPGDQIRLEARQFNFQAHSKYQITVEDTGIGMSPGFLEHLFDPYSRETAFSSHSTVGTGLGMAIVKSLVQQMSGEISVESQLGKGSRFTITLPLQSLHRQAPASPQALPNSTPMDWSGRTVLLAEDNELNREILQDILQQFGMEVLCAVNGREAVEQFRHSPPFSIDIILMDMQMPVMDGCQAAEAIRQLDRADARDIPIVAVTANAFAEDIDRTTKSGMNDHISKPINRAALQEAMQRLMVEWDALRTARTDKNTDGGEPC